MRSSEQVRPGFLDGPAAGLKDRDWNATEDIPGTRLRPTAPRAKASTRCRRPVEHHCPLSRARSARKPAVSRRPRVVSDPGHPARLVGGQVDRVKAGMAMS